MTNHEHYFGTPEAASRMEVRFCSHPIRVQVWVTEPMSRVTTHSRIIKDFSGVRDYLSWLESEYDDGTIVFKEDTGFPERKARQGAGSQGARGGG